jgi:hypothetical protein
MAYTRPPNSVVAGVGLAQIPASQSLSPSGISPVTLNANIATTSSLGIVQIGGNINVTPGGVISIPQNVSSNANVTFGNVTITGNVIINGNSAVSSVTPVAGVGIGISNLIANGPDVSFEVTNIGVLSLIAGVGISISSSTGNVTISATGADIINTITVTADYTATSNDEYIGVDSANPVTITLPTGINGRTYIITDEHGAGAGLITIQGTGGELINGTTAEIAIPYSSITVVFNSGMWHII